MTSMNNYIGDELAHRVKILSVALSHADQIIKTLEEQNQTLQDVLNALTSIKKEDHADTREVLCVQ